LKYFCINSVTIVLGVCKMQILSEPTPVINSHHIETRILRPRAWEDWFEDTHRHNGRCWHIIDIIKLCVLLAVWIYITIVLVSCSTESKVTKTVVTAMPEEIVLSKVTLSHDYLRITLRGPIDVHLTTYPQRAKSFGAGVRVEYRDSSLSVVYRRTDMWNIALNPKAKYNKVTKFFKITAPKVKDIQAVVSVEGKGDEPVGLLMEMEARTMSDMLVLYAGLLIILLYLVIITGVIDRTLVALLISAISIATLSILKDRPNLITIVSFINFETLMLLFGHMAIVDLMATSGVFDYLVVLAYRVSMGRPWPLVFFLSMLTAFLSAFLNSDNIALVLTPVTIRLCETTALQTEAVLIVMAIYGNLGGALTPLGNPTNAIVSNHPVAVANGVNFVNYTARMLPGVFVSMLVVFPLLYLMLRKDMLRPEQRQQDVMNQRAQKMMPLDEDVLARINLRMEKQPRKWWLKPGANYYETLERLKDRYPIRDKPLLIKCCITLVFAYLCLILHSIHGVADGATLGWVILLAAFLLIILDNKSHLDGTLAIIQWTILLFIASLFILTETVARLGLFRWVGEKAALALSMAISHNQSKVVIMVLIWVTAALSILIDNLVITNFMLTFCFEVTERNDLPVQPMIWAITFGSCFGSNGSLLAAWSNEIIAWTARKSGYKIRFCRFFIIGFPIMLVTLFICSAYLMIDQAITLALNPV
ncbi:hypothetical protein KR038_009105, partial [Drosophila bunnanda]